MCDSLFSRGYEHIVLVHYRELSEDSKMPTKRSTLLDYQPSFLDLDVRPDCTKRDLYIEEDECLAMSNQDQKAGLGNASMYEYSRTMSYQEGKPDLTILEATPRRSIAMDAKTGRTRLTYGNHTVSEELCFPERMPEIHISSSIASLEDWCSPEEMPIDAHIEGKKTEWSIGGAQIDDKFSLEMLHQRGNEATHSAKFQTIAEEIARACECDSRLLALMERALSDVSDIETWEDALDSLSLQNASCRNDTENLSVNVLKFSIEQLEDDTTRECLKSFVLHSKDTEVARSSLADCWIGEGLLATNAEGETIINNLLDAKLLELSENGELVKFLNLDHHIHDLIFQPEEGFEFLMRGGLGLEEPPELEEWESAKEICLMHNDFSELPETPRCPSLTTLFLHGNHKLRTIPRSFFSRMPALEVLNLSRTRIKSLPDSLFELVNLKRLFLNECILLRTLSAKVGGLEKLEVFDLEGTKLTGLPKEMQQLVNLTCLEVSVFGGGSKHAEQIDSFIPYGVLSSLQLLEELNINVGFDTERWDSCAEDLLEEICSLERLSTLKFYFPKVELLRKFDAAPLTHFRLSVGKHVDRVMSRIPCDIYFELERWDRYLKYVHGEGVVEDVIKVLKLADAFFLDRHADLKKIWSS